MLCYLTLAINSSFERLDIGDGTLFCLLIMFCKAVISPCMSNYWFAFPIFCNFKWNIQTDLLYLENLHVCSCSVLRSCIYEIRV